MLSLQATSSPSLLHGRVWWIATLVCSVSLACSNTAPSPPLNQESTNAHKASLEEVPERSDAPDTQAESASGSERTPKAGKEFKETAATPWLRELTSRKKCNQVMGCPALEEVVKLGEVSVPELIRILEGSPSIAPFRPFVLEALGKIGDKAATKTLLKELAPPFWPNRVAAIVSLGRIRDRSAVTSLREILNKPDAYQPATLAAAGYAMYRMGDRNYADQITSLTTPEAIQTVNWGYTRIALELATELGLIEALPGARIALLHDDYFLRSQAIETIRILKDRHAVPEIIRMLNDPIPSLRQKARSTLQELSGLPLMRAGDFSHWCQGQGLCPLPKPVHTQP